MLSKIIEKIEKFGFIDWFLILNPLIDVFTTFSILILELNISVGIIARSAILLFLLLYFIFKCNCNLSIKIYFFTILSYLFLFVLILSSNNSFFEMFLEIKGLIKSFYFPILLTIFFSMYSTNQIKINLSRDLTLSGLIYCFFIIIPVIFGISLLTYSSGKGGYSGWFYAANEISTILTIISPIVLLYLINLNNKILKSIFLITYIYVLSIIGTKSTVIGFAISIIIFLLIYLIRYMIIKRRANKSKFIQILIIAITFTSFLIFISPAINNIKLQNSWANKIFKNGWQYSNNDTKGNIYKITNMKTMTDIETRIINSKMINMIFSSRNIYVINAYKLWNDSPLKFKLFGTGMYQNNSQKLVEIDAFDIFYSYGILGFTLYFLPYILIIIKITNYLIKNKEQVLKKDYLIACIISCMLGIGISLIAGHTLIAPAVSIFIAIITTTLYNELKEIENHYIM